MTKRHVKKKTVRKPSIWRSWRHFAAYIYLAICVFDFVGMPIYYEIAHAPLSDLEMLAAVQKLNTESQIPALQVIATEQRWEPLTLGETGLFHLAFGAILGVAAFTRGSERIARVKNGLPSDDTIEEEHFEELPSEAQDPKEGCY